MRQPRGFSLIEVLVATSIAAVGVAALAQLFAIAIRANYSAKATTFAVVLAQQKMEQLRALTWGIDALGVPVSDTTTNTAAAEPAADGFGLTPSPEDSLGRNTSGYCDFVDGNGNTLGGGPAPPAGAVYVRRWSVEPLPSSPDTTLILQVLVMHVRQSTAASASGGSAPILGDARLVSIKTRKAF